MREGKGLLRNKQNVQYREALNKFNAAKLCDPTKAAEVDSEIQRVFDAIELKKQEAERERDRASEASKRAEKLSNQSKSLFFASEAEKLNPIQGLRLLEYAYPKATEPWAIKLFKKKIEGNFNGSDAHRYQERIRFGLTGDDIHGMPQSLMIPNDSFIIVYYENYAKVLELRKNGDPLIFKENLNIIFATMRSDTIIFISKDTDSAYRFFEGVNGSGQKTLIDLDNLVLYSFSDNRHMLLSKDLKGAVTVSNSNKPKNPVTIKNTLEIDQAEFTQDDNWLVILDALKPKVYSASTGAEQTFSDTNPYWDSTGVYDSIFVSPDSKWMALRDIDETIDVAQIPSGKVQYKLPAGNIEVVDFSPDGKWMVTKDKEKNNRVWETATGKECPFLAKEEGVKLVKFSPDNKLLASYNGTWKVTIWDLSTQKEINFREIKDDVDNIAFSPNSNLIALHTKGNKLFVRDQKNDTVNFTFNNFPDRALKFSKDNKWFISEDVFSSYQNIWDAQTGEQPQFQKEDYQIKKIGFSVDSKLVATINDKDSLKIWTLDSSVNEKSIHDYDPESSYYKDIRISNNDKWMIVKDRDQSEKLIEVDNFKQLKCCEGEKDFIFSPRNDWLTTTSISGDSKTIWDLNTGKQLNFIKSKVNEVRFSPDSNWLQITDEKNLIKLYKTKDSTECDLLKNQAISFAQFSDDSKMLFTKDTAKNSGVWNMVTGNFSPVDTKEGILDYGYFSPDDKWFEAHYRARNRKDSIEIYQISSGKPFFHDSLERIVSVNFSPACKWVALKKEESEAAVWDIDSKQTLILDDIEDVIFSPDSNWMAVTTDNSEVYIFNKTDSLDDIFFKRPDLFSVKHLYFLRSKNLIEVIHNNNTVDIVDLTTMKSIAFKDGEKISEVQYSENGNWLVTTNLNYRLKFRSADSLQEVSGLKKETKIRGYYFSSDQSMLLTVDDHNILKIWHLPGGTFKKIDTLANFSTDNIVAFTGQWLITKEQHRVIVHDVSSGKIVLQYWVSASIDDVKFTNSNYLLIKAGNSIVKVDINSKRGNFFRYIDSGSMDYSFDEIQEWIKLFGNQYLLPLSESIKRNYGIIDTEKNR
jgi:hypothetical protein